MLQCNVCRTTFTSRNKLFQHIKDSGHTQKVDTELPGDVNSDKGKKGKGKRAGKKLKPTPGHD